MKLPWQAYLSEAIGTALLVLIGLSFVVLDFGRGSPVVAMLPSAALRRAVTGFLFGATGGAIAYSWIGKASGAHINPVVTLAFRIRGKLSTRDTAGYIVAQFVGAWLGALPLLVWGPMGRSVAFGSTTPGPAYGDWVALGGEVVATACLIAGLFTFLGHRRWRRFTPLLFPFLFALLVWLEAPLSGTSTNPARSFGPSVVAGVWSGWWVYLAGPLIGMLAGLAVHRVPWLRGLEVEVAKVYHFEEDRYGVFGRGSQRTAGTTSRE